VEAEVEGEPPDAFATVAGGLYLDVSHGHGPAVVLHVQDGAGVGLQLPARHGSHAHADLKVSHLLREHLYALTETRRASGPAPDSRPVSR
jgi:hypothetical protein